MDYRKGTGKWEVFGNTNPGTSFSLPAGGFSPSTRYSFRVRAFKGNPVVYTGYSNIASTTTKGFQAPAALLAKAEGEGAIALSWKDRSSIEEGYEIETKSTAGDFTSLGSVKANVSSTTPITGFSLNTEYQFRIRGFRTVAGKKVYSAYSNTSATRTSTLAAPSGLTARLVGESSVQLAWKDRSARENGFQIQYREAGTVNFKVLGSVAANASTYDTSVLLPGTTYDFRVRAFDYFSYSSFTSVIQVTARDGIISDLHPEVFWNTSFLYPIKVSRPARLSSLAVTGLPAGLSYNPALRTISGTPCVGGCRQGGLEGGFSGWLWGLEVAGVENHPPARRADRDCRIRSGEHRRRHLHHGLGRREIRGSRCAGRQAREYHGGQL